MKRYQKISELGRGGMGVVYLAEDKTLNRKVALKFLAEPFARHATARKRLLREARAAAAIEHPFICSIYEVVSDDYETFIAMEFVQGETLKDRLKDGPLSPEQAISMALEMSEAIATAHEVGILHRDLKPANVMLTSDGHIKVMDFGLAKLLARGGEDPDSTTVENLTRDGETPGSPAYMSPEQLRGHELDNRSDLFSFGIVLCEMFGGVHPFRRNTVTDISRAILNDSPDIQLGPSTAVAAGLKRLLARMLAKDQGQRPQSATEVRCELLRLQSYLSMADFSHILPTLKHTLGRPRFLVPAVIALGLLICLAIYAYSRNAKMNWARNSISEIRRLADLGEHRDAYLLAEKVENVLADDAELEATWPIIASDFGAISDPDGADVFLRNYDDPNDHWTLIGKTPISDVRVFKSPKRVRFSKEGYHPVELLAESFARVTLLEVGMAPKDMVLVRGGTNLRLELTGLDHLRAPVEDFLIDRFEVTNAQFAEFVAAGGYRKRSFWQHAFLKDGQQLSWEEAMSEFRDRTGRPGPAGWELGQYAQGHDDLPVSGVSWYEAAAYAQFVDKRLPTVFHWKRAAGGGVHQIPVSNFGTSGIGHVGKYQGVNSNGAYDMAGNVKEWCWNAAGGRGRYILGGAWNEPYYMFFDPDVQSPFARLPEYGFRCMRLPTGEALTAEALADIVPPSRDYNDERHVPRNVFETYARFFAYDQGAIEESAKLVDEETSEHWIREKVSINAAYGGERMAVYVFLPRVGTPPYQPIVYFPGSGALHGVTRSSETRLALAPIDFIIRSGRALCIPVYKSTYERDDGLRSDRPDMSNNYRDHIIYWYKDLARCIDYLETRDDLDMKRLGYYGNSWGAAMGAILPALEKRISACVLHAGGFWQQRSQDEAEQINYAPHVQVPVLMLNGAYDNVFPVETSQKPMFSLLGTEQKKHLTYESGHLVPRNENIKETLDWFDRFLGSVDLIAR